MLDCVRKTRILNHRRKLCRKFFPGFATQNERLKKERIAEKAFNLIICVRASSFCVGPLAKFEIKLLPAELQAMDFLVGNKNCNEMLVKNMARM